ncbi:hypothetical protein HNP33_003161 [Comamonas odontotermitis]|uniref:Secreted protein n=1 Tax=Comamonas odontotermitis TaxID=379895 RepID=A0ABR6RIQ9_9BURK|nr:hypothetical protein [Comamonas odontotermitis]MBB6579051.1 hypothetical protein [Comamonas odontotermitis]
MKHIFNALLYLFAAIGVLNTAVMVYAHLGRPETCTQSAMAKANAPDNSQWAEITWQQCNSQADPELRLSIHTNGGKRNYSTLVGDPTTTEIGLNWTANHTLEVIYPASYAPTQMATQVAGIQLHWKKRPASGDSATAP